MEINRTNMQRPANRKRKSSLANVLQPFQGLKKSGLPPLAETEAEPGSVEPNDILFEPSILPDSCLADLFKNGTSDEFLDKNSQANPVLPFPIFTPQFIEMHRKEENEVSRIINGVNGSRRTARLLQRKNGYALQQSQSSSKACRELRANNKQIKDYLLNFRSQLAPLLTQLEAELPNRKVPPSDISISTQEIAHYLKDLGRRIWEHGPDDEGTNQRTQNSLPQPKP